MIFVVLFGSFHFVALLFECYEVQKYHRQNHQVSIPLTLEPLQLVLFKSNDNIRNDLSFYDCQILLI